MASEWHPINNGSLTPEQVTVGSIRNVWWLGKTCGHEWDATIKHRMKASGCPICAGRRVLVGFNDLATINPELIAQWHPTKNGELTPEYVTAKSSQRVWWKCNKDHEWEKSIRSRNRGVGCPFCPKIHIRKNLNDLATVNPVLATEWHPTKNGELTPAQIAAWSSKKVWWQCKEKHEWEASVSNRQTWGCPYCSGRKVLAGYNDLGTKNPALAAKWHPTKNKELTPQKVSPGTNTKVWWLCDKKHEWRSMIVDANKREGRCPYCSGRKVLAGYNDLATTHPSLAAEWHPIKNGTLTPQKISAGSERVVWWLGKCGHEWDKFPYVRIDGDRIRGCPYCLGNQFLSGFNDLATLNPELAKEWHPTKNGALTPEQVPVGFKQKVWWFGKCGHEWEAIVANRTQSGTDCHYCSGHKVLIGFNDLETKNPILATEWHPTKNVGLIAKQITVSSTKKVWWLCQKGHEWEAIVAGRNTGNGCSQCSNQVSKAEKQIKDLLEEKGLNVEGSNRTILKPLEIDLWIPEKNVGIEYNGIYWHNEKRKGKDSHYNKWFASKKAGIQLIQIWEDDWNLRPEIIMRSLAHKLGIAKTEPVAGDTKIIALTDQQAKEFLIAHHLQGFKSGSYYLGLVESRDIETLQAVMVLDIESNNEDRSLEILRYASIANVTEDFSTLLSYAINAYSSESITVIADHCEAHEELYVSNDFIAEKELPPDYMYVIRTERKLRSEYPIERFRNDPVLIWEEGLTEMELADLNSLNRIWDAGKTLYRYWA